jgi:hypothetical protein
VDSLPRVPLARTYANSGSNTQDDLGAARCFRRKADNSSTFLPQLNQLRYGDNFGDAKLVKVTWKQIPPNRLYLGYLRRWSTKSSKKRLHNRNVNGYRLAFALKPALDFVPQQFIEIRWKKFLFQQLNHFVPIAQSAPNRKRYQISALPLKRSMAALKRSLLVAFRATDSSSTRSKNWFTVIPFSSPLKDTPQV